MTRTLLFQNNVPKNFWSEAVLTATYLINRLPSAILDFKCPIEILYNKKPNINHLKVFGCTCFVHKNKIDKLDFTSIKTFFVGYSLEKKGFKCYDPKTRKLYISRDVTFFENESFYNKNEENHSNEVLSNEFVIPCVTNLERREILLENVEIGNQESEGDEQLLEDRNRRK